MKTLQSLLSSCRVPCSCQPFPFFMWSSITWMNHLILVILYGPLSFKLHFSWSSCSWSLRGNTIVFATLKLLLEILNFSFNENLILSSSLLFSHRYFSDILYAFLRVCSFQFLSAHVWALVVNINLKYVLCSFFLSFFLSFLLDPLDPWYWFCNSTKFKTVLCPVDFCFDFLVNLFHFMTYSVM